MTVTTPWLDRRELRAWIRLRAVTELLPGALDTRLRRDAGVSEFEYFLMAMLSEAHDRALPMTELARQVNATLPRLSHVVTRLEGRGLVGRHPHPQDRRTTNVRLTDDGWATVRHAAPGHVADVRRHVVDVLTDEQIGQLTAIGDAILAELDPAGTMAATYTRYDDDQEPGRPGPAAGT